MAHRVCPCWLGYFLINPLRRLGQNPRKILGPYLGEGMTALEPGPGLGYFTLEMARLVGSTGRVVAVDLQKKMVEGLRRRAAKAGLAERIECRLAGEGSLELSNYAGRADFVLVFAVAHEVPDQRRFLGELASAMKPGGRLLLAEPKGHVSQADFAETLRLAAQAGLRVQSEPEISGSRTALLVMGSR